MTLIRSTVDSIAATIRAWAWIIVVAALVGALAGLAGFRAVAPVYASRAMILVSMPATAIDVTPEDVAATSAVAETYANLATTGALLQRAIDRSGVPTDVISLQKSVRAATLPETSLVEVDVTDLDEARAAMLAGAIAAELIDYPLTGAESTAAPVPLDVTVVDPAVAAETPEGVGIGVTALLAAVLGLLMALTIIVLVEGIRAGDGLESAGGVISRVADALGISWKVAASMTALFIPGIAVVVLVSLLAHSLLAATALAAVAFVLVVSLRWPLLPLFAFALLVPIEELVVLGSLGTISRYAGVLFVIAYGLPRLGRLRISAMPIPAWVYVGWCILSVGWAINPPAAVADLSVLLLLFAVSVLIAAIVSERPAIVAPLMWTYSLSASATALVGIYFYVKGNTIAGDRVAALPGQDPAHYAALLLPALAFTLFQLVNLRSVVLSAAVAAVCMTAIAVSGTRGAWVATIVVIFLFIVPRLNGTLRLISFGGIVLAVLVSLQLPGVQQIVAERAATALSSGGAGRTDIWAVGLNIFRSAPVTGVGLANFPDAYTPQLVRESDVGVYSANNPANRAPHSIIVGTLGELGIVGFTLLALFLVPLMIRRGWGPDGGAIQAALVSLMISALFLDVLGRKQVWFIIGIACGLVYLAQAERVQEAWRQRPGRTVAGPSLRLTEGFREADTQFD